MIALDPIYQADQSVSTANPRSILVIDDDLDMLGIISKILEEIPDLEISSSADPHQALELLQRRKFNVVLTDIMMPGLTGMDLLEQVVLLDADIQVILMTGYDDNSNMRRAIQLGAFDFLRKPFSAAELVLAVQQALNKNRLILQNKDYRDNLELKIEERTIELLQAKNQLESLYLKTIRSMINAIEVTDSFTAGHSERVTRISLCLGRLLQLSGDEMHILQIGAMLHDLGKIGKISTIVSKHTRVSPLEYDKIKDHPLLGARIIAPLGLPDAVYDIIMQHHEWVDGTGYPYGLNADKINFLAKIVSVADSFDAMTSARSYRKNLSFIEAAKEIKSLAGIQFDATISELFYREFETIQAALSGSDPGF